MIEEKISTSIHIRPTSDNFAAMNEKVLAQTQNFPVPVRIVIESRKSARIALRKSQIILRIPKGMNMQQKNQVASELLDWANKTIQEKNLYISNELEIFKDGGKISVLGSNYLIQHALISGDKGFIHISRSNSLIKISIPIHISQDFELKKVAIKQLLVKGFNQYFLPNIKKRVHELNKQHFNAEIAKVKLRYTSSRWGSCSSEGSISLSTKLLLVPPIVCDYVIIHEIAHRFEMNHSENFWALVEHAMPDYKEHLNWLKSHGNQIDI